MRITTLTAIAALALTGASGTAFAKAHDQPADQADFGQFVVASDATGQDGEKGVDGQEISEKAKMKERPEGDPNRQGPKSDDPDE